MPLVGSLPYESLAGKERMNGYLRQMEEFLVDDRASVLGIYGMGGIGKTTLLRMFHDHKLIGSNAGRGFDHIFFIKVSRVVDVEKIKKDIADQLGFLLLLDDVWKEVDLASMRIPLPSPENGCKVIITARSKSYCRIKNIDPKYKTRSFEVSTLTEPEAWMFFQSKVCQDLDSDGGEIMRLAKTVTRRCDGLPLALEIIGISMIDANVLMWREAKKNLLRSPQYQKGVKEVLYFLKLSFDELEDDNIRNCLLYCCLFEEEEIPKDSLINFWFAEGFLDRDYYQSLHEARERGYNIITTLVSCSLLQETSDDDYVRTHDVVREMCLWLASGEFDKYGKFYSYHREDYNRTSITAASRLLAEANSSSAKRTLPKDSILGPELKTLLCKGFSIEEGLFRGCTHVRVLQLRYCVLNFPLENLCLLKQLRYLDLSSITLTNLPEEIGSLLELVYLDLSSNWDLRVLPNSICMLVNLQTLELSRTGLKELPRTIGSLTKLEILGLSCATELEIFPDDAVWSLVNLRILDLHHTKVQPLPISKCNLHNSIFEDVTKHD